MALSLALGAYAAPLDTTAIPGSIVTRKQWFRVLGLTLTACAVMPEWLFAPFGTELCLGEQLNAYDFYVEFRRMLIVFQDPSIFVAGFCCGAICRAATNGSANANQRGRHASGSLPWLFLATGYAQSFSQLLFNQIVRAQIHPMPFVVAEEFLPLLLAGPLCIHSLQQGRLRPHALYALCLGSAIPCLLARVLPTKPKLSAAYYVLLALSFVIIAAALYLNGRETRSKLDLDTPKMDTEPSFEQPASWLDVYPLAPRERQIATAYAAGQSSREIAEQLGIKPSTVRTTMQRCYKKLKVDGRQDFLNLAATNAPRAAAMSASGRLFTGPSLTTRLTRAAAALAAFALLIPLGLARNTTAPWGHLRPYVYGASIILFILSLALSTRNGEDDEPGLETAPGPFATIACPLFALLLGFSWEELTRGPVWYSLSPQITPFLSLSSLVVPIALYRDGRKPHAIVLVVAVALCALSASSAPLFLCSAAALVTLHDALGHTGATASSARARMLAAFALGALAGDYCVNCVGTFISGNDGFTTAFGGRVAFAAVLSFLSYAASAAAGTMAPAVLVRHFTHEDFAAISLKTPPGERARIEHALLGHGLNSTQAAVCLDILSGMSSAEIAAARHYARGTVNAARDSAYKLLGVHNRRELAFLFMQVDGM